LPEFSIIIPVRNEARTLRACLEALQGQTIARKRFEIIVVDDGSSDDSPKIAGGCADRLIRLGKEGAAAARNRGFAAATGSVIVFLDADCVPAPDWLERMTAFLVDPQIGGTVGRFVSDQRSWVARMVQLELDRRYSRLERFRDIDFVNTATCAFRREVLPDPPFDETFGKLEDLELSFRLAGAGVRMRYVADAVVRHHHPESIVSYALRRFRYGRFSTLLYRRYSSKIVADSSTPHTRRLQLIFLGLAFPAILLSGWVSLALLALSLLCSASTIFAAARRSPGLALVSPLFVLSGNTAFVAGTALGLATSLLRRTPVRKPVKQLSEDSEPANDTKLA
jgi:cellulose synthase/poly-beta-1,6-N-acetylglucosamine synthase-like glycosyltransferase